ncbi:ribonuclease III [Agrocybe pediades]|nr:ribonuclease III [Agrocybe pediades]
MVESKPQVWENAIPPLPPIRKEALEQRAFIHSSYHGRPSKRFEDPEHDPLRDYERLEHLGDSVLGLHVTAMLFRMYPDLTEGWASRIRSMLINNDTLSEISQRYKLQEKLIAHPVQVGKIRQIPGIAADLFEFNARFPNEKKTLQYKMLPPAASGQPPLWYASASVGGRVYSSGGCHTKKKDAGREVAKKALIDHGALPTILT